jgi:hypothetical protein
VEVHIFKQRLVPLLDISDLSVNLISKPVVSLDNLASVKLRDLFVNDAFFLFACEFTDNCLHLLNVSLILDMSLACDP